MHSEPLTRSGLNSILERMTKLGHIRGRMNPHTCRHAFARDALRNRGNIGEVSQLLGHKVPGITLKYYARLARRELQDVH